MVQLDRDGQHGSKTEKQKKTMEAQKDRGIYLARHQKKKKQKKDYWKDRQKERKAERQEKQMKGLNKDNVFFRLQWMVFHERQHQQLQVSYLLQAKLHYLPGNLFDLRQVVLKSEKKVIIIERQHTKQRANLFILRYLGCCGCNYFKNATFLTVQPWSSG